jgi:hypothetical protein
MSANLARTQGLGMPVTRSLPKTDLRARDHEPTFRKDEMRRLYRSELYRKVLDLLAAGENVKTVAVDLTLSDQNTRQRRRTHLPHLGRRGHVRHSATAGGTKLSFCSGTRGEDCSVGALFTRTGV